MANKSTTRDTCDLRVSFFYARGELDGSLVDQLVGKLQVLFQLDAIYLIARAGRSDELKNYSKLSDVAIANACKTGQVVLCDEKQRTFTCLIEAARSSTSNSEIHNEIAVVTNEPVVVDPGFEERVLDFVRSVALEIRPAFCYACDLSSADYRYGRARAGLSHGLRDIYWINVFGPPFLNLIGKNKLLALSSASSVEEISESLILVSLSGPRGAQVQEQQDRLKLEIGMEYFIENGESVQGSVSGGGPLSLVKHLWMLGKAKPAQEMAQKVPRFD